MASTTVAVVRLRVPPTYVLPDLAPLADIVLPGRTTSSTTIVADTPDLALARWGVALTHDDDAWRCTLPQHPAGAVSPTCHRVVTRAGTIPARLRHALARLVDGDELGRVVRYVVRRDAVALLGEGDEPLVQVTDEEVSVHTGRRLTGRFREVVVHPGPQAPSGLADAVVQRLLDAGALGHEEQPRAVRVLGPAAQALPDLPPSAPGDGALAAWSQALVEAVHELLLADVHLRLDDTGAVAGPSRTVVDRVAGLAELLDAPGAVRAPLAALREHVVEVDRLVARRAAVEDLGAEVVALRDAADAACVAAVAALHAHLDGPQHLEAVRALRALATAPGLPEDEAEQDVRASVAARVGKRWSPVAAGLTGGMPGEPVELTALAAGAGVAPGKAPARFARAASRAAEAAREHARATAVQVWLAEVAEELPAREAFAAGRLAGRRHGEVDDALAAWTEALARLQRDRATGWLGTGEST